MDQPLPHRDATAHSVREGTGLAALVAGGGSRMPVLPPRDSPGRIAAATASDIIHCLVLVHGRPRGIVEQARGSSPPELADWFAAADRAFDAERALLQSLSALVGPQPNTPQHDSALAAFLGHIRATDMLASSGRQGCAAGAALAFLADWLAVRPLIDDIADRLGHAGTDAPLPDAASLAGAEWTVLSDPARVRGFWFGAEQMLLQQRGFWDLIAARAAARAAATE